MADEITTTETPFPLDNHMVVLAKDPHEMQASQQQLIGWFQERVQLAKNELDEAETNLELAKSRKWATQGWKRQVGLAKGRVNFYDKCLAALDAGYCIIPDFPTDIFAIRTKRKKPTANKRTSPGNWTPNLRPQTSDSPPAGEGEYHSPDAFIETSEHTYKRKDHRGELVEDSKITAWASDFDVPDFPMKVVKPQILDATGKAMARKIFDEIGVLPARRPRNRGGDPIVTGRIMRREGTREIGLTFLISWWIDTRDL
jgi:hypothetical protein